MSMLMQPCTARLALAAGATLFCFAALHGLTPSARGQMHHQGHPAVGAEAWTRGDPFARDLYASMARMHEEMTARAPTGDADRDFLAMMIPHHAGAVEMARLVLIAGKDPLVRQLAEEIIAGQQAEIAAMRARLAILDRGADPAPGGFPALGGTRGP